MQIGKNYLIHCGDWHTFVGYCNRQIGPLIFELTQVSKVDDTHGGDNWHLLAKGDKAARKEVSWLHYDTPACVPLSIIAFLWEGDLPSRK